MTTDAPATDSFSPSSSSRPPARWRQAVAAATAVPVLVEGLGWLGLGIGLAEMVLPGVIGRAAGLQDRTGLVRLFGARTLATGLGLLRTERKAFWLRARLAGDGLDGLALLYGMRPGNPYRDKALGAFLLICPMLAADLLCAYRTRPWTSPWASPRA